jgi:hypothetical protein
VIIITPDIPCSRDDGIDIGEQQSNPPKNKKKTDIFRIFDSFANERGK